VIARTEEFDRESLIKHFETCAAADAATLGMRPLSEMLAEAESNGACYIPYKYELELDDSDVDPLDVDEQRLWLSLDSE
jgi:hypothetical protein